MLPIPVFVPRRLDHGRRDEIWHHLKLNYWASLPYKVVEGYHNDGPFNRSAAINRASELWGDWDYAIIADSDSFVAPEQLKRAIDLAINSSSMVIAHDGWASLSQELTNSILNNENPALHAEYRRPTYLSVSGVIVVPKIVWDAVNGFDESFIGYGWEDMAFNVACHQFNKVKRVSGECWHMYHDKAVRDKKLFAIGEQRYNQYLMSYTTNPLHQ